MDLTLGKRTRSDTDSAILSNAYLVCCIFCPERPIRCSSEELNSNRFWHWHMEGVYKFRATRFYIVASNILSTIIAAFFSLRTKNVYQLTRTEQEAPDKSEVYRSLHDCGYSERNLLPRILLAPRIWRWLLDILKTCGYLEISSGCS